MIKVNDTEIDSLDVYSVILETTPEGESLNFTVQQTRANEEKRLSETSELATVIPAPPIPPRELTPGWLASIAVANPQNHSGMEKVLVQSERRAGIVSIIDTDSMDRIGSTPHRLVGGTLSSERDDDGSNIMPIFSDGILLYVLDAKSRESTFVNIFQAKGSIMSTLSSTKRKLVMPESVPGSKWISVRTERGDYYYYHRETRETTWDTPIGFSPLHDETSASQNESKTTTTSKTTATQSRQNFGFEFLRCIKLSWVIKDSDSIPEGNLHKFCLKSSFFTNGMRLHALWEEIAVLVTQEGRGKNG